MDKSILVRIFGFSATLIHGDPMVLDRWLWLKRRLPKTNNGERLIDIGCGSGAFSIGAALRGYESLGLSWDERNQSVARQRAKVCRADTAEFEVLDVRELDGRADLLAKYDVAICFENVEHIIDDRKLICDIAACLRPGGRLLLTTPHALFRAISSSSGENGPFSAVEDGAHVRRGYSKSMLAELCQTAGLAVEEVSYCGGFLSQKVASLDRMLGRIHPLLGWISILPLRVFPPLLDKPIHGLTAWPYYSICLEAYKPRFAPRDE